MWKIFAGTSLQEPEIQKGFLCACPHVLLRFFCGSRACRIMRCCLMSKRQAFEINRQLHTRCKRQSGRSASVRKKPSRRRGIVSVKACRAVCGTRFREKAFFSGKNSTVCSVSLPVCARPEKDAASSSSCGGICALFSEEKTIFQKTEPASGLRAGSESGRNLLHGKQDK